MAIIKGTNSKKFSKARTDLDVPAIARAAQVAQGLSLTSSADIDVNTVENLYFHILGDLPTQIILFIYGEKFTPIHYTELGIHQHGPGTLATGNVASGSTSHGHTGSVSLGSHGHSASSTSAGNHTHALKIQTNPYQSSDTAVDTLNWAVGDTGYDTIINGNPSDTWINYGGTHSHTITVNSTNLGSQGLSINSASVDSHGHLVTTGLSANAGLTPAFGSMHLTGTAKSYFDDMKIAIDGVDKTAQLLTQASLVKFGDGTAGHVIVTTGIQLDLIPFVSTPGQHKITFSIASGANNGGKIRYNLYTVA